METNKVILSVVIIVCIALYVFYMTKKYQLSKNQIVIFWILVLFWSTLSIIRAYRKIYALDPIATGGLALGATVAAQITAGYGLVSFLVRLPMFFVSDMIKRRKIFVQIAVFFVGVTSFLVGFAPSYTTLYLSSLAMGLAATMVALFNVIFSETFSLDKATVSVSILSVAPLLAEFIAAPIQYMMTSGEYKHYNYLWLVSGVLALVTGILTVMMKDHASRNRRFSLQKVKVVLKHQSFLYLCVIALFLSFIKFSTSGPNMIAYAKSELGMPPFLLAYQDVVFTIPQLIAGLLMGMYLTRKIGVRNTLLASLAAAFLFNVIVLYTNHPVVFLFSYILNGLAYGGAYNLLIAMAMQYFDRDYRNISMGIYQGFFALGIYYGDYIYVLIAKYLKDGLFGFTQSKAIFLMTLILIVISMVMVFVNVREE